MVHKALNSFSIGDRDFFKKKEIDIDRILTALKKKLRGGISVYFKNKEERSNLEDEVIQIVLIRATNHARNLAQRGKKSEAVLRAVTAPALVQDWITTVISDHRREYQRMK
ncbi:MAG: hypothetical protein AABX02_00320, partial [archaeon]